VGDSFCLSTEYFVCLDSEAKTVCIQQSMMNEHDAPREYCQLDKTTDLKYGTGIACT
jgi:hypothetical protein